MKNQPTTAQFNVVGGVVQERGPFMGIYEAETARELPLYIVVETSAMWGQDASRRAMETIKRVFRGHRLSTTSGLSRGIKAAHEELRAENLHTIAHHRIGLGITCATIRGNDLFIAQANPAQAYILSQHGLKRLSRHRDGEEVGMVPDLHVHLHRHQIEAGDRLLLCFSSLSQLIAEDDLESVLRQEPRDAARALYVAARNQANFSVLIMDLSLTTEASPATPQGTPLSRRPSPLTPGPAPRGILWLQSLKRLVLRGLGWVGTLLGTLGSSIASAFAILLKWLRSRRGVWLGAAVLLLLTLGALWYVPGYLSRQSDARFNSILVEARGARAAALAAPDRDNARNHLERAYRLINEALTIRGSDSQALSLKKDIEGELTSINGVFELGDTRVVANFSTIRGGTVRPDAFVLAGGEFYVLDKNSNRVYSYPLAAKSGVAATEVIRAGEKVKENVVQSLDKALWMPPGDLRSQGALLIFDSRRALYEYDSKQGLRPLVIRGAGDWRSFQATAGFNGSLYVLDSQGGQVWRYAPTESGYDSERRGVLSGGGIAEATDMAIDGSIYLLSGSGKVMKFASGQRANFSQQGLDKPITQAVAIFTSAATKYVYVLDVGNQRVVVFNKEGGFVRQLVSPALRSAQGLWVDEAKGVMYILSEGNLYDASIPK